jgi:hypothetical protein
MNCKQFICLDVNIVNQYVGFDISPTRKVVYGSILASFTTILQSAGVLGGLGYFVSALSTLPILIATILSLQMGFLTYIVAVGLIAIIQPSELFAFPFTTGLLGLSMGLAFRYFKKGFLITFFSGGSLTLGILSILYIIQFPILGPSVSSGMDMNTIAIIVLFSIFYSWIWMKGFILLVKKYDRMIGKNGFKFLKGSS